MDPNIQIIKVSFELNIRRLCLQNAVDDTDFTILWMRGEKKIDTKTKQAWQGQIKFSEKFMMKTNLEFNIQKNEYFSKPVS